MPSEPDPIVRSVPPAPDEPPESPPSERASDYRRALAALPFGVVVVDADGIVVFANARSEDLLSVGAETFVGEPLGLPLTDHNRQAEVEVRTADGGYRIVQIRSEPLRWRDDDATLVTVHDVTDPREREQALAKSNERYSLAMSGANDGLWDWDLVAGTFHVNDRWRELLGLDDVPEATGDPSIWLDRTMDADKTRLLDALGAHLGGRDEFFSVEHRLQAADGRYVWMLARGQAVVDDTGEPIRIAGSLTDVSARKRLEERLVHEARHDPLTGLANRRLLLERIDEAASRAGRHGEWFGVVLLDLDGFKGVNDTHGHEIGDSLLVEVASRLATAIRPTDIAARLGGDEFALVLDDLGPPASLDGIVERLHEQLGETYRIGDLELTVPAAIGLAATGDAGHADLLLGVADKAMYEAKRRGRPVISLL